MKFINQMICELSSEITSVQIMKRLPNVWVNNDNQKHELPEKPSVLLFRREKFDHNGDKMFLEDGQKEPLSKPQT